MDDIIIQNAGWIRLRARRFYTNDYEADDLASETIFRCLNNADKFNYDMNFKPWALAIMSNIYITAYNRRQCVTFTDMDDRDTYSGFDHTDQRAIIGGILSAIRECGRKSRCIECVLYYAKGYSYPEIAEMLGILEGTVKSRIAAGRKMLRRLIG